MTRKADLKPAKPWAGYPLNPHASGQWAKRVHGKQHYFGPWADHKGALDRYNAMMNGSPLPSTATETVGNRVAAFLATKEAHFTTDKISDATIKEYRAVCKVITDHYGKGHPVESADFNTLRVAIAQGQRVKTLGVYAQKRRLIIARMIFPEPASADALSPPSSKQLRQAKEASGERFFEAADIRALVAAADEQFRWLLLLGINCAFGPRDCELFPGVHDGEEWHDFPRPKTGVSRRCWLWPETRDALKHQCEGWDRFNISKAFADLCESTGVENHGFYSLKRTFVTVAEGSQPAIDRICGWARNDMASIYRQKTFDDQLRAVAEGVRNWYLSVD